MIVRACSARTHSATQSHTRSVSLNPHYSPRGGAVISILLGRKFGLSYKPSLSAEPELFALSFTALYTRHLLFLPLHSRAEGSLSGCKGQGHRASLPLLQSLFSLQRH